MAPAFICGCLAVGLEVWWLMRAAEANPDVTVGGAYDPRPARDKAAQVAGRVLVHATGKVGQSGEGAPAWIGRDQADANDVLGIVKGFSFKLGANVSGEGSTGETESGTNRSALGGQAGVTKAADGRPVAEHLAEAAAALAKNPQARAAIEATLTKNGIDAKLLK